MMPAPQRRKLRTEKVTDSIHPNTIANTPPPHYRIGTTDTRRIATTDTRRIGTPLFGFQ